MVVSASAKREVADDMQQQRDSAAQTQRVRESDDKPLSAQRAVRDSQCEPDEAVDHGDYVVSHGGVGSRGGAGSGGAANLKHVTATISMLQQCTARPKLCFNLAHHHVATASCGPTYSVVCFGPGG